MIVGSVEGEENYMLKRTAISLLSVGAIALAAFTGAAEAQNKGGVNVGTLTCKVAGGMGFIIGSSKDLNCLFVRNDGVAEKYTGSITRFGVDIGFTKEGHMVWLVFAPGNLAPGSVAGDYVGGTAQATVGGGGAVNVLVGGGAQNITLQPVSVEGNTGLNVAAGVAGVTLKYAK
ncbi:Protein of unknown function [Enhydrobacter aerosaccus]|uniref:DUF992 domain-containing protein n=1 Tax=Enhydrobacter aerosaccus TaxID=225324 RepID=A0A1T4QLT0_9HYPH|nr:Protein of unknown function [Enhydrobacter aerosaccus]